MSSELDGSGPNRVTRREAIARLVGGCGAAVVAFGTTATASAAENRGLVDFTGARADSSSGRSAPRTR